MPWHGGHRIGKQCQCGPGRSFIKRKMFPKWVSRYGDRAYRAKPNQFIHWNKPWIAINISTKTNVVFIRSSTMLLAYMHVASIYISSVLSLVNQAQHRQYVYAYKQWHWYKAEPIHFQLKEQNVVCLFFYQCVVYTLLSQKRTQEKYWIKSFIFDFRSLVTF